MKINEVILEGVTDLGDGKRFPWDGVDALTKSQNNARLAKLEKSVQPQVIADYLDLGGANVDHLKRVLTKRGIKNPNDIDFMIGVGMAIHAEQTTTRSTSGNAGAAPATVPQPTAPTAPANATPAPGAWQDINGIQIKPATGTTPTLARYKKNLFSLTDTGNWLDQNGRPANVTISAFLNQALDQT